MLLLLAQLNDLPGMSGWVGTGLLGSVLAWLLLRHLPEKDKQLMDLVKAKDDAVDSVVKAFRQEIGAERSACEKNTGIIAASIDKLADSVSRERRTP